MFRRCGRRNAGFPQGTAAMSSEVPANAKTSGQAAADSAPLKLEEFLPYRLNVVASLVSQALSRIYSERYGIGVPEWRVLVTLGQFGMMTGKDIGAHTHMHKTKVSRAVAQLEKRKFLTRRVNRSDLREAFLSLTTNGRAIYEDLAPSAIEFAKRLFDGLDPAERAAFDRALKHLTESSAALVSEAMANPKGLATGGQRPADNDDEAWPNAKEDA
jgi:DNA-binding MarR family transcriptional regulator